MSAFDSQAFRGARIRESLSPRSRQQAKIAEFSVATVQSAMKLSRLIAARDSMIDPTPDVDEVIEYLTKQIERHFFECFGHEMIQRGSDRTS